MNVKAIATELANQEGQHLVTRTVLDPRAHNGIVIWRSHPGSSIAIDFDGRWSPNVGSNDDYYDALGLKTEQRHEANKYQVILRLHFSRIDGGEASHSTDWFPYTGRTMRFGPYENWQAELSAKMNDARRWDDNANDPSDPMTALILRIRF